MTVIIPGTAVKPPAMQFISIAITDLSYDLHQVIIEFDLIRFESTYLFQPFHIPRVVTFIAVVIVKDELNASFIQEICHLPK